MSSLLSLLLCFLVITNSYGINICDEENLQIRVGLRFNEYTVLISFNKKVYRINNFKFSTNYFTFDDIEDLTTQWIKKEDELYAFPLRYVKNNKTEIRIIHIRKEMSEGPEEELVSYQTLHSKDLKKVLAEDRFSTLLYKYKPMPTNRPEFDPLTLYTLFAKFPEKSIVDNIKTILAFPLNEEKNLPPRLFVYYLEKNSNENRFKRHVMIGESIVYKMSGHSVTNPSFDFDDFGIDWRHDFYSGKCIDEDFVVNASFPITDYISDERNQYSFLIIEFCGHLYFVKRVTLDKESVGQTLPIVKVGTIASIFGCKTSATVPVFTTKTTKTQSVYTSEPPKYILGKRSKSNPITILIVLSTITIVVTIGAIILMTYDVFHPSELIL